MYIGTKQILTILYVVAWIIFIGICIEACGFIVYAALTQMLSPENASRLWKQVDLTALFAYDRGFFFVQTLLIIIVAVLRATLFYLIIRLLHGKKLDLSRPFNLHVQRFILAFAYVSMGIGFFSQWGAKYGEWLAAKGIIMPDAEHMRLGGADVWLFMSITLFVIAQIFKRGIELQTENDLTI